MEYDLSVTGERALILLRGRVTFQSHREYKALLDEILTKKVATFEFNFSAVDYIDSAGLGMLLIAKERAGKQDAAVIISKPSPDVRKLLDIARFGQLFDIQD